MRIELRTRPAWPFVMAAVIVLVVSIVVYAAHNSGDIAVDVDFADADCDDSETECALPVMLARMPELGVGGAVSMDAPSPFVPECTSDEVVYKVPEAAVTDAPAEESSLTISVYDHRQDRVIDMDFEEYIYRVTASEMPARCASEALKAQAVAARTYAYLKLSRGGCGRHGADICTDSGHCQAYHDAAELIANWGDNAKANEDKVRAAVEETRGLIITYGGQPINALFHASSGGHTEDVENVYAEALPYLRGVDSPGEENYTGYLSERKFSEKEFRSRAAKLGCELTDDTLESQVSVSARTDAGQVAVLQVGKGALSGRQARKAFGLRSQCFDVSFSDGGIAFEVRGFGHGVGMSQNGADAMARAGSDFIAIITHYYTGVDITQIASSLWA